MLLRKNVAPRTLIRIGMMAFAIANITGWALRRQHVMGEDRLDAINGFLLGIAIATMLLGVWRLGRGAPRD
jgi:hypothetical protein